MLQVQEEVVAGRTWVCNSAQSIGYTVIQERPFGRYNKLVGFTFWFAQIQANLL